jgi:hypothetical protein
LPIAFQTNIESRTISRFQYIAIIIFHEFEEKQLKCKMIAKQPVGVESPLAASLIQSSNSTVRSNNVDESHQGAKFSIMANRGHKHSAAQRRQKHGKCMLFIPYALAR